LKATLGVKQVRVAAKTADDKLGEDIKILDVRNQTAVADYFLFISGSSHVHVRALEDAVRAQLKDEGANLLRTDGQRGQLWRALDYGSFIVHIMDKKSRELKSIIKDSVFDSLRVSSNFPSKMRISSSNC